MFSTVVCFKGHLRTESSISRTNGGTYERCSLAYFDHKHKSLIMDQTVTNSPFFSSIIPYLNMIWAGTLISFVRIEKWSGLIMVDDSSRANGKYDEIQLIHLGDYVYKKN